MPKYLPAILVSTFTVLAIGGAIGYAIHASSPKRAVLAASTDLTETSTSSGAPLTPQSESQPQTGQSLGVSSGGDIGSTLQSNLGQSSGTRSSGSGNGSSSSSANAPTTLDPTTFAQYDKYKDATSALEADIVVGTGTAVMAKSKVTVTYKGWLTNGTLFDQSKTNDSGKLEAFQFQVGAGAVIKGWEEDVIGMKVGGRRLFIIPPSVGYGAAGQGPIPGNAVLVFDVTLYAVE